MMSRLLRGEGHEVVIAHSKADALAKADGSFDLLISDIGLPDGTGQELMRELRGRVPIPGIALSGFGADKDIEASLSAGFTEHLTKPIDFQHLLDAIYRLAATCAEQAVP